MKKNTSIASAIVLQLCCAVGVQAKATDTETSADAIDYEAAARFYPSNLYGLVKNEEITPHWIDGSDSFWYIRESEGAFQFTRVDASSGDRAPAFEHQELAAALTEALSLAEPLSAKDLPLRNVSIDFTAGTLIASIGDQAVSCNLKPVSCQPEETPAPEPGLLLSPNGRQAAFIDDQNLYLRDMESGEDKPLTTDGSLYHAYGKMPDRNLMAISLKRTGRQLPPVGANWSPDSRFLIVPRVDERQIGMMPYLDWVPSDGTTRPVLYELKIPQTGDEHQLKRDLYFFDTQTGQVVRPELPEHAEGGRRVGKIAGWNPSANTVFLVFESTDGTAVFLDEVNLLTGETRVVLEETDTPRYQGHTKLYSTPIIRVIKDGTEVIWFSERSGWGHLYRYDARTGELINAITRGNWVVFDLIEVDEADGSIVFTAGGKEEGVDPYYRQLYRVNLDGSGLIRLTAANADHEFEPPLSETIRILWGIPPGQPRISPSGNYVVDTYSRLDMPPVTEIRDARTGELVVVLETADAAALYATGWNPPRRFKVKAADGVTDIYGAMYLPYDLDTQHTYPVIDAAYAGPQSIVAPKSFRDGYLGNHPIARMSLAALGFVVVSIDGRATPYRNKAFWEVGYPAFTDISIEDHVSAIQQLAEQHDFLDLRPGVGVYGHSWGGTFAARALLKKPDFYTVGIASAGLHDYTLMFSGYESVLGVPEYENGAHVRSGPQDRPLNYAEFDNIHLAGNLKGELMLIFSDLDENVTPANTLAFASALVKENKSFELVFLPGQDHNFLDFRAYYIRSMWDFFIRHLQGIEPPRHQALDIK